MSLAPQPNWADLIGLGGILLFIYLILGRLRKVVNKSERKGRE